MKESETVNENSLKRDHMFVFKLHLQASLLKLRWPVFNYKQKLHDLNEQPKFGSILLPYDIKVKNT